MAPSQPAFRADPVDHRHPATGTCPYCDQPIPNERAAEIRERYARDQAAMKARLDQQVEDARKQIEADKNTEIAKVKAEALAQLDAAREQGKKTAEAQAEQKVQQLVASQQADKLKLEESERQRLAAVNQYEALKTQTDTIITARVAEARAALEKSNAETVNAKDAQHAEAMQKLSDQLKAVQRRIDAVEGEGADINLVDQLKEHFPEDKIRAVNKTSGANIIHVVMHNNKECGTIVYDAGNRKIWQKKFATNLHQDMVSANATHAILTTSKFPDGANHIHLCEGVIAANPARVLILAEILRDEIVRNFSQRVSTQDQTKKTAKLYAFITSDEFNNLFDSLEGTDDKLLQLDEDEKKDHKKVWERRRALTTESQRLHAKIRLQIARIVGTAETE